MIIEATGDRGSYQARVLSPTEAAGIWPQLIATYPPFARYQRRTTRTIPVIELSRVDSNDRAPILSSPRPR